MIEINIKERYTKEIENEKIKCKSIISSSFDINSS